MHIFIPKLTFSLVVIKCRALFQKSSFHSSCKTNIFITDLTCSLNIVNLCSNSNIFIEIQMYTIIPNIESWKQILKPNLMFFIESCKTNINFSKYYIFHWKLLNTYFPQLLGLIENHLRHIFTPIIMLSLKVKKCIQLFQNIHFH
jgi:hypothetical protein